MKKNKELKSNIQKNQSNDLIILFLGIFISLSVASCIFAAVSQGDTWKDMLFHKGIYTDWFMDFFNSIRDCAASNVYSERNNIYPPLAVFFFRLLSYILPERMITTRFDERYYLQQNQLCIMAYLIFSIVIIALMYRTITRYGNNKELVLPADLCAFASIVSYPVLYCLERGNITVVSLVFSMFFVFFRDSQSKLIRYMSYIFLAMAAGLKYYPAAFGLLLLAEKKYKDIIKLVAFGISAFVLPLILLAVIPAPVQTSAEIYMMQNSNNKVYYVSTYAESDKQIINDSNKIEYGLKKDEKMAEYKGKTEDSEVEVDSATVASEENQKTPEVSKSVSVFSIIGNAFKFTSKKGASLNFSSVSVKNVFLIMDKISNMFNYYAETGECGAFGGVCSFLGKVFGMGWGKLASAVCIVTEIIALAAFFLAKKNWQRVFLISYLFLNIAVLSSSYALSFVTIPFIMLLFEKKKPSKSELFYTVMFSLLLSPVPTFWYGFESSVRFFSEAVMSIPYCSKVNQVIATPIFQLVFVVMVIEIIKTYIKSKKNVAVNAEDKIG